jgi:hypothetical protein
MSVNIGIAIMHHPARHERLARVVEACAPLRPRLVIDPDPGGIPSPLRTAKLAWTMIEPHTTHHLVLHDDVIPTRDFARHLSEVVRSRPHNPIALYSNWNSPQNAYLVRRSAAFGAAWARLSRAEWTPAEGLVLPVDQARDLASFLLTLPDEIADDDEMAAVFFERKNIPVYVTIPHLVDHADEVSLTLHHGSYHATVYADACFLGPDHWTRMGSFDIDEATDNTQDMRQDLFVEFSGSLCLARMSQPQHEEPIEHPYGWYWYDWCLLYGVDPEAIVAACQASVCTGDTTPSPEAPSYAQIQLATLLELWAACYLLGWDTGTEERISRSAETRSALLRRAIASWVDSGLHPDEAAVLDESSRSFLVDTGVLATAHGQRSRAVPSPSRTSRKPSAHPAVSDVIDEMACREAAVRFLVPPYVPASSIMATPALALQLVDCVECGSTASSVEAPAALSPLTRNNHAILLCETDDALDLPQIRMLSCEALAARSFLPVVSLAYQIGKQSNGVFISRAVAWAQYTVGLELRDETIYDVIRRIHLAERWASALPVTRDAAALSRVVHGARENHECLVLPASTRINPNALRQASSQNSETRWSQIRESLVSHFLTPHQPDLIPSTLNERYMDNLVTASQRYREVGLLI